MADLAAFPFLAPHSLRRPPVGGGSPVVAGLVPNPMSWGGSGGPEGGVRGEGGGSVGGRAATPLGWEAAITGPSKFNVQEL